jgi:hypothetical protein
MPSEIYQTTHFGVSTENGFGSIYHEYTKSKSVCPNCCMAANGKTKQLTINEK